MKKKFGVELVLDLHDCDPKVIRSRQKLRSYAIQICKLLKMKRYGRTLLPHFGHADPMTSGYSMLQFIETSSITGHFSELTNTAYLNIFSCGEFNPKRAREFTVKFFRAKKVHNRIIVRE